MRLSKAVLISLAGHAMVLGIASVLATPEVRPVALPIMLTAAIVPGRDDRPQASPRRDTPQPRQNTPVRRRETTPALAVPLLTSSAPSPPERDQGQTVALKAEGLAASHTGGRGGEPAGTDRAEGTGLTLPRGYGVGNYYGIVIARLEQVRRYPREERRRGSEGTVLVRFVLARDGSVLACRIEKGSGSEGLDREVSRMVQRAAPFPPVPENISSDQLALVVPVTFTLKR